MAEILGSISSSYANIFEDMKKQGLISPDKKVAPENNFFTDLDLNDESFEFLISEMEKRNGVKLPRHLKRHIFNAFDLVAAFYNLKSGRSQN